MSLRSRHSFTQTELCTSDAILQGLALARQKSRSICNERVLLGLTRSQGKQREESNYYEKFAELLIDELGLEEQAD
jgi:hypothetical protein